MSDDFILVAWPWWFTNLGALLAQGVLSVRPRHRAVRVVFTVSLAFHIGEAAYAYRSAHTAGFTRSARKWMLQTLALGFPSLFALQKAKRRHHGNDLPSARPAADMHPLETPDDSGAGSAYVR